MYKEDMVCIYNNLLISHEKGWYLAICDNMGEHKVCYTKWNKWDWKRQIQYDFIYMFNLKKKRINKHQTHKYREQTGGCQKGGG